MRDGIKNLITGTMLFTVIGLTIYATANDITPTDTINSLTAIKEDWDNAVKEVKIEKGEIEPEETKEKVKESKEVNKNTILAQEELDKKEKEESTEVLYIDGELYERVIGEKCDEINEACTSIIALMRDSSCLDDADLSRKERKSLLKNANIVIENYEYIMEQQVPKQHKNILNAFRANCIKGYKLSKDLVENYKDYTIEDFQAFDDAIVLVRNGTNAVFNGYRQCDNN